MLLQGNGSENHGRRMGKEEEEGRGRGEEDEQEGAGEKTLDIKGKRMQGDGKEGEILVLKTG